MEETEQTRSAKRSTTYAFSEKIFLRIQAACAPITQKFSEKSAGGNGRNQKSRLHGKLVLVNQTQPPPNNTHKFSSNDPGSLPPKNQQPATSNQQPATSNKKPETGN